MKVLIPAAGYATRLYPLTKDNPKHLLDVQGKPIIEHVIDKTLNLEGVDEILIVTNNKFYANFMNWVKNFSCSVPVKVFNDGTISNEDRLGQIGDIQFVIDKARVDDDLIVIAGDNLFDFQLEDVHSFFIENGSIINALYDVGCKEDAKQLGVVTLDDNNKIIEFEEKPESPKSTLASMGIYLLPKNKVGMISKYLEQGNKPDKMGYFMEWLLVNEDLSGFVYKGNWFDIGYHSALEKAREEFNKK